MATFDSFFNKVLFSGKYRIVRHLLFQLPIFMMSLNAFGAADGRIFDFSRQNVPQWLIMYAYLLTCWYVNIYILTPRFFFKDKILKFTISTILLSLPFGVVKVLSEVFETGRRVSWISEGDKLDEPMIYNAVPLKVEVGAVQQALCAYIRIVPKNKEV